MFRLESFIPRNIRTFSGGCLLVFWGFVLGSALGSSLLHYSCNSKTDLAWIVNGIEILNPLNSTEILIPSKKTAR